MLQQEFTKRVGMEVTPAEWEHINAVYTASDVDKDTFCHMWLVMNKKRVAAYKERVKRQQAEQAKRDKLWKMLEKYGWREYSWKESHFASDTLTKTEKALCEEARIDTYAKRMSDVCWAVRKYLKAA